VANKNGSAGGAAMSSDDITESVGKELKNNPPKILAQTASKFGQQRAQKQKVAILLSKSRKLGANIPKLPRLRSPK
jgi:hypothetical protein